MAERFSDKELAKFYEDFRTHIEDYNATMIRCDSRFNDVCRLLESTNSLLATQIEDTKGVVELHAELQGAARLGTRVQNVFFWFAKWGVLGSACVIALKWLSEHFPGK